MRKKKFALIFLAAALVLQLCQSSFLPVRAEDGADLTLYAKSAVLMDAESGRVLYEKDGYAHMPNASTTKIMTCILALEKGNLDDTVSVSSYAASMPQVHLGMNTEDTFCLRDLLYSLMLESHNDSAVAIAEHIAGSVEEFAAMMNQKAAELGCQDTYFITPNGLDAQDEQGIHGTTAADLARIMSYCIQNETFLEITRTASYSFSNMAGTRTYSCTNHNAFLQMMDGALSGKTGFTGNAGYCYIGALQKDGKTFVVTLLACGWPNNRTYKWADTKKLMTYGLEHYSYENVFEEKELPRIEVENGIWKEEKLYEKVFVTPVLEKAELSLLKRSDEEIRRVYDLPQKLKAPVTEGQKIGTVTYFLGEEKIAEYPVKAEKTVKELDLSWYVNYILERFFLKKELSLESF